MDLDLRLLAQVRLESRQRYMALVMHFLTVPLYDVMTLVASGSHQIGAARTRTHLREGGLRRLLQTPCSVAPGRKKGASGASRAPVRQAYGEVGGSESVGRPMRAV